jgi:glycosyltransferase involved in cell wall biosynthesis
LSAVGDVGGRPNPGGERPIQRRGQAARVAKGMIDVVRGRLRRERCPASSGAWRVPTMKVEIWHNILWSAYKGAIFNEIYRSAQTRQVDVRFVQIAKTEMNRIALGPVDLSCHDYPYELVFDRVYEQVPKTSMIKELARRIWRSDADITILPGYNKLEYWVQLLCLVLRRRARGVFCDSTAYDRRRSPTKALAKRLFFSFCDVVFCYGERSRQYVRDHGIPDEKIVLQCQAAAVPPHYSKGRTMALRKESIPADPRFLYVGRLSPEKNLARLIEAFGEVRKTYKNATLRLVGDGPIKEELKQLARVRRIEGLVWVGSLDGANTVVEYLSATALVLPSISEPWGLVVNEAMSYGCPVVVSERCGCVPELVKEGETGFVVNPFDVQDIAAKIEMAAGLASIGNTAEACIECVSKFSPRHAGEQILNGCVRRISVDS